MHIITTIGPDNATNAVLPYIAAKGELAYKENPRVNMFLMQEATYLASPEHANLNEINAPGLPSVRDVLDALIDANQQDNLEFECIVCKPCAEVRGVTDIDTEIYGFGGAGDLARQAAINETTVTF